MANVPRMGLAFLSLILVVPVLCLPAHADVVTGEWVTKIETYLSEVDSNTTAEVVVFVTQSLVGHGFKDEGGNEITDIVQLGVYIFNELALDTPKGPVVGIGKTGKDNGVLVLVVMDQSEWRIEVGYGLEGDITDIESNLIAQQRLVPKFTEGKYGEGLYDTVVALSEEIPRLSQPDPSAVRGRYFYENAVQPAVELPLWAVVLLIGVFGVVIVAIIIIAILVKKGKIKMTRTSSGRGWGGGGGRSGGGGRPGGGARGGGGRSGGGGSGGKWRYLPYSRLT